MDNKCNDKATLHFCRMRGKEDDLFYDPQTDIRIILSKVMQDSDALLQKLLTADPEALKAQQHIANCLTIFNLRLREDHTPLAEQFDSFLLALKEVPADSLRKFCEVYFIQLMAVYALFVRRDTKADKSDVTAINTAATVMTLMSSVLTRSQSQFLADSLQDRSVRASTMVLAPGAVDNSITAVEDNGLVIADIKGMAARYIGASGNQSWDALAKACNDAFAGAAADTLSSTETVKEAVALAIAYPNYKTPYKDVTVGE